MDRFQAGVFVTIGVIIAALAIISTFGFSNMIWESKWIEFALAGFALALSVVAIIVAVRKGKASKK